ncbi:MAG: sarcosine oxidase subunit gamma family protein [Microbacteriaceae bacterium]
MADTDVIGLVELRRSPLQHLTGELAAASVPGPRGVSLTERAFCTMISVRVGPRTPAAARLEQVLGAALPKPGGTVTASAEYQVLPLGPDEFLVFSATEDDALTARLTEALGEDPGLVVDLSANRTTLELSGPSARAVLEKGAVIDLHPRAFGPGSAVSSTLGPVPVILWQTDDAPSYRILPRASFADYTARWLLHAMVEFAGPEESSWR